MAVTKEALATKLDELNSIPRLYNNNLKEMVGLVM